MPISTNRAKIIGRRELAPYGRGGVASFYQEKDVQNLAGQDNKTSDIILIDNALNNELITHECLCVNQNIVKFTTDINTAYGYYRGYSLLLSELNDYIHGTIEEWHKLRFSRAVHKGDRAYYDTTDNSFYFRCNLTGKYRISVVLVLRIIYDNELSLDGADDYLSVYNDKTSILRDLEIKVCINNIAIEPFIANAGTYAGATQEPPLTIISPQINFAGSDIINLQGNDIVDLRLNVFNKDAPMGYDLNFEGVVTINYIGD